MCNTLVQFQRKWNLDLHVTWTLLTNFLPGKGSIAPILKQSALHLITLEIYYKGEHETSKQKLKKKGFKIIEVTIKN